MSTEPQASDTAPKPSLAVFKFASCDGCQLQLLDAQGRLLELADRVRIDHFLEASSLVVPGPRVSVMPDRRWTRARRGAR